MHTSMTKSLKGLFHYYKLNRSCRRRARPRRRWSDDLEALLKGCSTIAQLSGTQKRVYTNKKLLHSVGSRNLENSDLWVLNLPKSNDKKPMI